MLNYLFYRLSNTSFKKRIYWGKIFFLTIILITCLPLLIRLSKYFFGCYDYNSYDGLIKIILIAIVALLLVISNVYFSTGRVKIINDKYSKIPKHNGNIRLAFICLFLVGLFLYGSALLSLLLDIPKC